MSEEEDEFQGVITLCLSCLLLGIETRLEGALGAMARLNWAGMEMVRGWGGRAGAGRGAGNWRVERAAFWVAVWLCCPPPRLRTTLPGATQATP